MSDATAPANFYKYRAMDDASAKWVQRTICHAEAYFPPAATFNDPFDLRPAFSLEGAKKAQRADYIRLSKKFEPSKNRAERRAEAREVMSGPMRKSNIQQTTADIQAAHSAAITKTVGVYCVSTKRDDILMWAHYADCHRGVCLEFDGNSLFMQEAQAVLYTKERTPIKVYADTQMRMMEKALLTKSSQWSYEAEWRLLRYEEGPGLVTFAPAALTGVILGAQASSQTVASITKWVQQRATPIRIQRASTSNHLFALDIA